MSPLNCSHFRSIVTEVNSFTVVSCLGLLFTLCVRLSGLLSHWGRYHNRNLMVCAAIRVCCFPEAATRADPTREDNSKNERSDSNEDFKEKSSAWLSLSLNPVSIETFACAAKLGILAT